MIYHAVPMPRPSSLPTYIHGFARREIRDLNTEMIKTVAKLSGESPNHHSELIYLFDNDAAEHLERIKDGDALVIHAEGNPFIISPGFCNTPYTLTAGQLAEHLKNNSLPNVEVTIKILACNSGTQVESKTFAQDLSQALCYLHGIKRPIIEGYNGFIIVKKNSKYSATSIAQNSGTRVSKSISKGTHAKVDEVSCSYRKGRLLSPPKKILIPNTENPYSFLVRNDSADIGFLEKTYNYRHLAANEKRLQKMLRSTREDAEVAAISQEHNLLEKDPSTAARPSIILSPSPVFPSKIMILSPRNRSHSRSSPMHDSFQ